MSRIETIMNSKPNEMSTDEVKEIRDHLCQCRELLNMASAFADQNPDNEATYNDKTFHGYWLSAHIDDVLDGKEA